MTASIQSVALDERGAAAFERDRLLAARYGEAVSLAGGSWNGVLATLLDHRSVRSFSSKALPAGTLELLVAAAEVKPRLAQEAIVHTDRYDSGSLHGAVERYDARSDVFRSRQGLAPSRWSDQLIDRWRDAASLKGRHRLSDTLRRLGFPLR